MINLFQKLYLINKIIIRGSRRYTFFWGSVCRSKRFTILIYNPEIAHPSFYEFLSLSLFLSLFQKLYLLGSGDLEATLFFGVAFADQNAVQFLFIIQRLVPLHFMNFSLSLSLSTQNPGGVLRGVKKLIDYALIRM